MVTNANPRESLVCGSRTTWQREILPYREKTSSSWASVVCKDNPETCKLLPGFSPDEKRGFGASTPVSVLFFGSSAGALEAAFVGERERERCVGERERARAGAVATAESPLVVVAALSALVLQPPSFTLDADLSKIIGDGGDGEW